MRRFGFAKLMLWLGLLFIYLPMIIMVIYSFNASKLVTVWGGWSLKWYFGLLDNKQLIGSVFRSLEIAFYTAIAAVALGTVAAFVLTRIPHFRGRTLFGGMVTAPLVMPEVITGLSLLLLFVAMAQLVGWPAERGMLTIWIAHTTFCTAYVAIVVSARLRELDLSIEEAAMDLGSAVRLGVKPEINAIASLILLSVSLFTFGSWYLMARAEKRRRAEIAMTTQMQAVA